MNIKQIPADETPNYVKKMAALVDKGVIQRGEVAHITVAHDDWCAVYQGKACNCDPDIIHPTRGKLA